MAAIAHASPGDVLVLTMPRPEPVALVGELLATQAKVRGVAALLVDAAVRDLDELAEVGVPIWARYVRVRGGDKSVVGALDEPVEVGGVTIRAGDAVVLDSDGAVSVPAERVAAVLEASRARVIRTGEASEARVRCAVLRPRRPARARRGRGRPMSAERLSAARTTYRPPLQPRPDGPTPRGPATQGWRPET